MCCFERLFAQRILLRFLRIALFTIALLLSNLNLLAQYPVVAGTATSYTQNNTTSHNVALPAGIQNGDLLLVFWADRNLPSAIYIPSGWSVLYNVNENNIWRRLAIYRIADGTEGTVLLITTSQNERSAHNAYRIQAGTYAGLPVAGSVTSGMSSYPNPPNLISGFGIAPTLWIAASHSSGDDNSPSPEAPLNYGNLISGYTNYYGTDHVRMMTARRELTAASENPGQFTLGYTVTWGANTVAIAACINSSLSLTSGAGTDDQSLCYGETLTDITYSLYGSATGASASGLPPGVSASYSGNVLTISGTPSVTGTFNYMAITTGTPPPCEDDTVYGTITIHELPVVTWTNTLTNQCLNSMVYTLTGGDPPGGVYSGPGVSATNFNASAAGVGTHNLFYTYTDANGCSASDTNSITVYPLPVVTCPASFSVCIDEPSFALSGATPPGGTYNGHGVSGGIFDPAAAGQGSWPITYIYTDTNGCVNFCVFNITVYPLPVVTCPADFTVYIDDTPFLLSGATPSGGTYSGPGVSSNMFYPAVAGYGTWLIDYSYTDTHGCSSSCTFHITVTDRISISKNTVSVPLKPGDPFNYLISYSNLNTSTAAEDVTIIDELPEDSLFTYVMSTPPGTYDPLNRTLTWFFPSIPANTTGTITINGISGWPGEYFGYDTNSYYICSGSCNEIARNLVTIENPLTLPASDQVDDALEQFCGFEMPDTISGYIKSATPTTIYYIVTITNTGNITDKFIFSLILNQIPSTYDLDIEIQTLSGVPISETPWVQPGDSYTFRLAASIVTGTPPDEHNYATFSATSYVCNITKSTYIHTITYGGQIPGNGVDLVMTKTAPSPVYVQTSLIYTLFVTNVGVDIAKEIKINDVLPATVVYNSSTPPPTSITGNVLYWEWPTQLVPNDSPIVISIDVTPTCSSMPGVYNIAYASCKTTGNVPEITPEDNIDTLYTEIYSNIPPPIVNGTMICAGETATLTAHGASPGYNYHWYDAPVYGNLLYTGNPYITSVLFSDTVFYAAIFDVDDSICESNRTAATVMVLQEPVITLQPDDQAVCEGQNATFSTAAEGRQLSYHWECSTDGGSTFTGLTNAYPYSGVFTPDLTITNTPLSFHEYQYRCLVKTGTCSFRVYCDPAVLSVYQYPEVITANVCLPAGPVTFSQNGGEPGGTWAVNGGGTINASGVFTPSATGCYVASYTTPSAGCSDSASFIVFPGAPPAPVVNGGCGPIIVTPPPAIAGFDIEYSFDDGVSWGANIPPTADSCGGYKIKTRYVTSGACGDYPAGTSSDVTACKESSATTRIVDITQPLITCPASINVMADTAMSYATVSLPPPVYSDNCTPLADIMLEWTMSPPTAGSGSGIIPVPYLFNIGITTVNYIATDLCGNSRSCSFTVTVTPNDPPEIICPANLSASTDTGLCTAAISPGFPALISGTEPIVYTWIMTGATNDAGMGPIVPDPYPFALGTTTITWIASNISGSDTCEQVVEVIDNEPPQFETPGPFEFCVMSIDTASWNGLLEPNTDIVPDRPDYYILENGNTALDPDISTFIDNCCPSDSLTLAWTINFSTGHPPVSGTGLPSQSGPITLWGDTNYNIVFHTITYVLIDCHGNNSTIRTATITIKPRPKVDKIF